MPNIRVCIVEDEPELAEVLQEYLTVENYSVHVIDNGIQASQWLEENNVDIILLDLMLPGKNGLDICKEVRHRNNTPIIMLTAKVEEVDRLIGLELGADDYICKPYSPREVVARVKAVLRRAQSDIDDDKKVSPIHLSVEKNTVTVYGSLVELTTVETHLFKLLYDAPGRIFSRQYILDNIYNDYRIVNERTVDSHIKKLRKKLHQAYSNHEFVRSVYGSGYKYEAP